LFPDATETFVIKPRGHCAALLPCFAAAWPDMKHVMLYRGGLKTIESMVRAFGSEPVDLWRSALYRSPALRRRYPGDAGGLKLVHVLDGADVALDWAREEGYFYGLDAMGRYCLLWCRILTMFQSFLRRGSSTRRGSNDDAGEGVCDGAVAGAGESRNAGGDAGGDVGWDAAGAGGDVDGDVGGDAGGDAVGWDAAGAGAADAVVLSFEDTVRDPDGMLAALCHWLFGGDACAIREAIGDRGTGAASKDVHGAGILSNKRIGRIARPRLTQAARAQCDGICDRLGVPRIDPSPQERAVPNAALNAECGGKMAAPAGALQQTLLSFFDGRVLRPVERRMG